MYRIIVECLENSHRHSLEIENRLRPSLFVIIKEMHHYQIISGNYINNDQVASIKNKLDEINKMSPAILKEKYREILINGKITEKGGAGLGIFDIAIKSGSPLEYDFFPGEKNSSLYVLKVKVGLPQDFFSINQE